jgi:mannose/fructose/N-acetylgalactosamine-specific phosphotransferase system component IIC
MRYLGGRVTTSSMKYDLPLIAGTVLGAIIGAVAGSLLAGLFIGLILGNVATATLRGAAGLPDRTPWERLSRRL